MTARFHETSTNHKIFDSLLIIEKDKIQRKGLAIAMMDMFKEIEMIIEPVEAIKLAANKNFDVILAVLNFEGESEIQEIKTLMKLNPAAKLIVICNELSEDVKRKIESVQVYKVFEKPFSVRSLIADIEQMVKNTEQSTENHNSINSK
jgi:DNA-binding NtrC family response regulator